MNDMQHDSNLLLQCATEAGAFLLVLRPFKVGDFVKAGLGRR